MFKYYLIVLFYCMICWVSMWAFLVPSEPDKSNTDYRNEDWNE